MNTLAANASFQSPEFAAMVIGIAFGTLLIFVAIGFLALLVRYAFESDDDDSQDAEDDDSKIEDKTRISVTNEDEPTEACGVSNASGPSVEGLLNEQGHLVLKIPYGEWPNAATIRGKKQAVIQVVNEAAALQMQGVFNNSETFMQKLRRWIGGNLHRASDVPLYVGHPDDPNSNDRDKASYGWLREVQVANDAMHLHYEPNEEALQMVKAKKYRFYSPHWDTVPLSNQQAGQPIKLMPVMLKSVGFTNMHALPVVPLTNEDGEQPETVTEVTEAQPVTNCCGCEASAGMRRTVAQKLYLDADATPEQIEAALNVRVAEVNRMQADLAALRAQLANEQAAKTQVANELTAAQALLAEKEARIISLVNEAQATQAELVAVRNEYVHTALLDLQNQGKIKPADFETTKDRLISLSNAEAKAELATLAKQTATLKTASTMDASTALDARKVSITNEAKQAEGGGLKAKLRSGFITDYMAAAALAKMPVSHRRAMAWEALTKQHPEWLD